MNRLCVSLNCPVSSICTEISSYLNRLGTLFRAELVNLDTVCSASLGVLSSFLEPPCRQKQNRIKQRFLCVFEVSRLDLYCRTSATKEEKHGTVYGYIALYTARNARRWLTIVSQREFGCIRTVYIQYKNGRNTVENGTSTPVYDQICLEKNYLL